MRIGLYVKPTGDDIERCKFWMDVFGLEGKENEVEIRLLREALDRLSKRERQIICLRYGIGTKDGIEMTQKEVADLLGISQSYISRLEKKIMIRLKKEIQKN